MPYLPTQLYDASVKQIKDHIDTDQKRRDILLFLENSKLIFNQIAWEGSRLDFTRRLVMLLPHDALIHLLIQIKNQYDNKQQQFIDDLCADLRADLNDASRTQSDKRLNTLNHSKWSARWALIAGIAISLMYLAFVYRQWATPEELFFLLPSFLALGLGIGMIVSVLSINKHYHVAFFITAPAPLLSFLFDQLSEKYIETVKASSEFDPGPGFQEIKERIGNLTQVSAPDPSLANTIVFLLSIAMFILVSGIVFGLITCLGTKIGLWLQEALFDSYGSSANEKLITLLTGCSGAIASLIIALLGLK